MYVCTAAALLSALCSVGKRSQHHTGTQLSSSQRPHSPQAQHSLIPAHQMLCSDWQCCKTPGIASLRMRCARPRDGCAGCTSSLGHKRGVRQCHLAPPVPLAGDTQLHGCPFQTCSSPSQLCLCNSHSPKYDEFAHQTALQQLPPHTQHLGAAPGSEAAAIRSLSKESWESRLQKGILFC